jgi:transposase-like protein
LKRLFYDIETSLAIGSFFQIGYNKSINYQDIILEPRIICICYKWGNEGKVYSLDWDEGNDEELIRSFVKVIEGADELVAHNGDGFDMPWIRGRAIKHGIHMQHDYPLVDTLKLARKRAGKGFKFQSNRLDYIAKFLGVGRKIKTDLSLWHRITYPALIPSLYELKNDYHKALDHMVKYCKMDVKVLESVYNKLKPYVPHKSHEGKNLGGSRWDCPKCGSGDSIKQQVRYSSAGIYRRRMKCNDCNYYFSISHRTEIDRDEFLLALRKARL